MAIPTYYQSFIFIKLPQSKVKTKLDNFPCNDVSENVQIVAHLSFKCL
jgi:hypothetical protein